MMHRRTFLLSCGFAATGSFFLPALLPATNGLQAADLTLRATAQLTAADRALLRLLSAYGSDVSFWGNGVLQRASGAQTQGAVDLLVQVADFRQMAAFLQSRSGKALGAILAQGNTLSFTFQGTAYAVTNVCAEDYVRAVRGGTVTRSRSLAHTGTGAFTHQTLLYHPATDTFSDPNLVLKTRKVDLLSVPSGGIQAKVQTLVDGWTEAKQHGLKLGKRFNNFQADLLTAVPTEKAADKVLKTIFANISTLAGMFSVDELRPLFTSPLVSSALQSGLGLDAETVLAKLEKLRAGLSTGDYADAALWLATLLGTQIQDGTIGEWLDLATGDRQTDLATGSALAGARRLLAPAVDPSSR